MKDTSLLSILVWILSSLLVTPITPAATIPVNCTSGSLQSAIDGTAAGDTIQVSGTCNENILIRNEKQRLTIDGLGSATINGPNVNSPTVNLRGKGILVQGFTITGGLEGINVNRGSNAVINNNLIQNTNGSGIIVQDLTFAVITNNLVTNNPGDGILINETATARIGFNADSDVAPSSNTIQGNLGRGITIGNRSSARILGNAINSNGQDGIGILRDSNAEVSGNAINANGSHGILVSDNSVLRLVESSEGGIFIASNSTAGGTLNQGFGVTCQSGSVIEGVIGTLNGTSGVSQLLSDCIAGVLALNQSPVAIADSTSTATNAPVIFSVTANDSDPDSDPLTVTSFTQGTNGTVSCTQSGICTYTPNTNFSGVDTFTYTISDGKGGFTTANATVTITPPDPSANAPAIDKSVATTLAKSTEFLYTGTSPIQTGVAPGTIQVNRLAVLRGRVLTREGNVLPGVTVSILNNSQFGQTVSRSNGLYDLAVNGGGLLTLNYTRPGYLPSQRQVNVPWQEYVNVPDVALIPLDTRATTITPNASFMQVHQSNTSTDADGSRKATLLFPAGTTATMTLPNGSTQPLATLNVRATEYTVGPNGPKAMPAQLPPSSGYTYAAELSADEAVAAGATAVSFSQPLSVYVENFLGFPVGGAVPTGFYDRQKGQWIASANGRVIKIVSFTNNLADLDVTGDNIADTGTTLTNLGITDTERQRLATLYSPNTSLWRVPITHFSPIDCNWPYGPPLGTISPPGQNGPNQNPGQNPNNSPVDNPNKECASVIGCENQSLGESLSVTGTPWRLHYQSERTLGRKDAFALEIPVSGVASIPALLREMRVEVNIAGRLYQASFAPAPNLTHAITWDGLDGYGRVPQGLQTAVVQVHYEYVPQYYASSDDLVYSFARAEAAGAALTTSGATSRVTLSKRWTERVGVWDARALGLGGWSLSLHHAYDPTAKVLYLGDGTRRDSQAISLAIITTVAGGGFGGDGGPATTAGLNRPSGVAVGPDGSLYIADSSNNRIRRVGIDGIITTVAGTGDPFFGGDGGPATAAEINGPQDVAMGLDGSLYIADTFNSRIRRVGIDGIITTVAGTGLPGFSGDGGPAVAAGISRPFGVAMGPDGSLYFADTDNARIRRVGTDGIITTVAGNGIHSLSGDGGPATSAGLDHPLGVAVGPDGSLYIADTTNNRIRRVRSDGIITTVAGSGNTAGFSGDGGPAVEAKLSGPYRVGVGLDGSLYISDTGNVFGHGRIRRVGPDGIITTVAGGSSSYRVNGVPATAARLIGPLGVAVGPDGGLYIADLEDGLIRRVGFVLPDISPSDVAVASEDGREVYVFNGNGRHLRTLDALTSALGYQFGYGADGYLTSITDGSGNVSTIERTGAAPSAIVAPGGQRTTLAVNSDGWLISKTNPAAEAHTMSYTVDGLLQQFIDPLANVHLFTYDALGRLIMDEDPVGGSTTLARTEQSTGYTVTTTSALGRNRGYRIEKLPTGGTRRSVTQPSGATTVTVIGTDGSAQTINPDGSVTTVLKGPDPRWGMLAPRVLNRVRTMPGGQTETTTSERIVSLADPSNLFSLQAMTDTVTVNGRTFTRSYNAATRTMIDTSAEGRQIVSILDAQGRIIRQDLAPGIDPIMVTYDAQGRVIEKRQGAQFWTLSYDARNRIISRTDAAGHSIGYAYDNNDRLVQKTLPSGAAYGYVYDANGNRTQVILPSGAQHELHYTAVDLDAGYTPPGNASYLKTYNVDGQRTGTTLPGGRIMNQSYDAFSRVSAMNYPEAVTGFEYFINDLTDRAARITNTPVAGPAQDIDYSYNGSLISGMTSSGIAPAQVSYSFDNDFFPTAMNFVSGTDTIQTGLVWDQDGLLSGFGPFTFTLAGPGGSLSQISDGNVSTSYNYDTLARLATRSHQVNGQTRYALQLSYDNGGRITGKTETVGGTTHAYTYTYDLDGQLVEVKRDNVVSEGYGYDLNGNRTSRQLGGGPIEAATYDSQDRLTQRGAIVYQFNADGFLTQRGGDTFQYNTRGQLVQAGVGVQTITYGYDGLGRRVSRTDGSGTYQYLYGDPASHMVTAVRNPAGMLTMLYYDSDGLLIALERGGARYAVATDHVGTPRVVADSTGAVVKTVESDSFGNVIADSNPAFDLPLGYAGGLADAVTGLVHFGFRDYDPAAGRWTARDPVLFEGGQGNLYVYVGNNPINNRDPSGLICVSVSLYDVVGGGVQTCIDGSGASVCVEGGVGVGAGVGVDNGSPQDTSLGVGFEVSAKCADVGVGLEGSAGVNDEGCAKRKLKGIGEAGPVKTKIDLSNPKLDSIQAKPGTITNEPKLKLSADCSAKAKAYGKACVKGEF